MASDTCYTDAAGITWRCVQWNASSASGLVLATPGLLDVLVVGGGCDLYAGVPGSGGRIADGYRNLPSGPHAITVGTNAAVRGSHSSIGSHVLAGSIGISYNTANVSGAGGTGTLADAAQEAGYSSSITGAAQTYARGNAATPVASRGDGGAAGSGTSGTVIVRVPV